MSGLSPSATIIFKYARENATENGYVDLQDYSDLPEHKVVNACYELRDYGIISDLVESDDSIEGIILKPR